MLPSLRIIPLGACIALLSVSRAADLQLNFGNAVSTTGWNNITTTIGNTDTGTLMDLVDSNGAATVVDFAMNARFNNVNANGASTGSTTNGFGIPNAVMASSLFGNSSTFSSVIASNPTFTLSSLDTNSTYTFTIYASRVAVSPVDNRTGLYTATGLNTVSGTVDATNNTSVTLTLLNVRPDATGKIVFDMKADAANNNANGFTYLNALKISATAIPEPATAATLVGALGLLLAASRRRSRSE